MWWMVLPIVLTLCAVALSGFVCAFLYRAGEIHIDLDKDFELPRLSEYDVFSDDYFWLLHRCVRLKRLTSLVQEAEGNSQWPACLIGCAAFSAAVCKKLVPDSVKGILLYVFLAASVALFFAMFFEANALIKRGYFHFDIPWYGFDYEEEPDAERQHRVPEPKDDFGLPLPLPDRKKWLEKESQRAFYKIDARIQAMEEQLKLYHRCFYLMYVPLAIAIAIIA